jgi:hypothetical protein
VKTGQRNLLLIVVDRQGERAQLEGVWLGVILPPTPRLLWLPIYPSASALDVAAAFALADGVPVEAFWETLRERQLWWDTSLVVGREEIEALGAPGTAAWPWGASATEGATRAQAAFLVDACANGGATALARGWLGDNLPGGGAALSCEFPTLGRIP